MPPVTTPPPAAAVPRPRRAAGGLLRLARPAEWAKNVLVLAPLVFAGLATEAAAAVDAMLAFAAFCLVASAGYAVNDVVDAPLDREHPVKRHRPVAAGEVLPREALAAAAAATAAALALGALAGGAALLGVLAAYAAVTAAYSLALKRVVIVDVMTIAGCFELRVVAGTVAVGVEGSSWLFVCTGAAALLFGMTKRRQEAMSELHDGRRTRPVLEHYSVPFLDQAVALTTAMAVVSYTIYAVEAPLAGDTMLLTVPPVLYAVLRYLHLIYTEGRTEDAAELALRDPGMLAASVTWLVTALVLVELA